MKDMRDMRDPEAMGLELLKSAEMERSAAATLDSPVPTLSQVHDRNVLLLMRNVPDYVGEFMDHSALRRKELLARAAEGDRFAEAELRGESLAEEPTD